MVSLHGTNLVTVGGAAITTGQKAFTNANALQLTTDTGPLTHGIFFQAKSSATYYLNTKGNDPAVTASNGVVIKANNPLFLPISDPSSIWIIASADDKTLSWIMY